MRLPKEKIIFTVDWIPIQGVQFRGMADTYLPDIEEGLNKVIAMDWETLIPGHPGPGGPPASRTMRASSSPICRTRLPR